MGMNLREMTFPSENFAEGEDSETRRCTFFGEAAAMIANDPDTLGIADFFKCFYNGFSEDSIIWFAYHDDNNDYENPFKFQLDSWRDDDYGFNSTKEIIGPRILPANFTSGWGTHTFEFYYPSIVARQLGFGQVPSHLYFADKVYARDAVNSSLAYNRLKSLEPSTDTVQLADWQITSFTTIPFSHWRS
jgi:hypothetical protein